MTVTVKVEGTKTFLVNVPDDFDEWNDASQVDYLFERIECDLDLDLDIVEMNWYD